MKPKLARRMAPWVQPPSHRSPGREPARPAIAHEALDFERDGPPPWRVPAGHSAPPVTRRQRRVWRLPPTFVGVPGRGPEARDADGRLAAGGGAPARLV